jgi:hypothetical protein
MCRTTKTDAGSSAGKPANSVINASTPPADAPITTMSRCEALLAVYPGSGVGGEAVVVGRITLLRCRV